MIIYLQLTFFFFFLLCSTLISPLTRLYPLSFQHSINTSGSLSWHSSSLLLKTLFNLSSWPKCQLTLLKCLLICEVTREAYPNELSQILHTPPSPVHIISPFTAWLFLNPYHHTHIHTISFSVSFCLKVKCIHMESIFILFTALSTYSTILPYNSDWLIYLQNLWHSRNFVNVSLMYILKEFIFERKKNNVTSLSLRMREKKKTGKDYSPLTYYCMHQFWKEKYGFYWYYNLYVGRRSYLMLYSLFPILFISVLLSL